jgi:fucose 4-O-acetylase-like acetyltransferase
MIRRFLYINGLAIMSVIVYHGSAWGFISIFYWADRYRLVEVPNFDMLGEPTYYILRAIEQLTSFGIPTFMLVSGFFIAFSSGKSQQPISWNLVFERIRGLAVPFILWSLIILGSQFAQGTRYTPLELVRTVALGQTTEAYYFIPVLIQLYLLAPLITPLARRRWKLLLAGAALLQIVVLLIRYDQILGLDIPILSSLSWLARSWFFTGYTFFFCLGIIIGFHLQSFKDF